MKRILITGGTGFFGKSMLDYRLRHANLHKTDWVILSREPSKFLTLHPEFANCAGVNFIKGDVRDFDVNETSFDAIIHAAAVLDPNCSAEEIYSASILGTQHIIDIARKTRCSKILFTSSGAVYGDSQSPLKETCLENPITPYGKAKLQAEKLLVSSGLDVRILRCFAFVGKYLDRTIYYAIGNFIRDALAGKDIVINGDGSPMRSYMYADDLVEWLFAILERGESGRVYNVGSPEAISIRDLAVKVRDVLGSKSEIKVLGKAVPGAANYYVPNVDRILSELGVRVRTPIEDAVRKSVE